MEPTVIENAAYILIAIGAFIFIISFLGYCGSIKESRVLLTSYGIFLIIIFILEVRVIEIQNLSLPSPTPTFRNHYFNLLDCPGGDGYCFPGEPH